MLIFKNQVLGKMPKAVKNRASKQSYLSQGQPLLDGFVTPFSKQLNVRNRWVVLGHKIHWDDIVSIYCKQMYNAKTGASSINPRVIKISIFTFFSADPN